MNKYLFSTLLSLLAFGCSNQSSKPADTTAITNVRLIDSASDSPIENAVLIISGERVIGAGPASTTSVPDNATVIAMEGKTIIPGLINAHGHIGGTTGLKAEYSKDNVVRDLATSAYYGVTSVYSLGGDQEESVLVRENRDSLYHNESRLFIAGDVVTGSTPEEARAIVDKNAAMKVDMIKIRVDDNLGATEKMRPDVYEAVIDQAKKYRLPVAAHIFYLDDAKALLRLGVRMIAHSVRDQIVDQEFIDMMIQSKAVYCPTLMREVSTFVYESTPDFFDDPFFLQRPDTSIIRQLKDPEYQKRISESTSAQAYKKALEIAKQNLKIVSDNGIPIAFGTDTGPPGRFQGYFEHLELSLMEEAGMTPAQILKAATSTAAAALSRSDIGALVPGAKADFIILSENPLENIKNSRTIEEVWINGEKIIR